MGASASTDGAGGSGDVDKYANLSNRQLRARLATTERKYHNVRRRLMHYIQIEEQLPYYGAIAVCVLAVPTVFAIRHTVVQRRLLDTVRQTAREQLAEQQSRFDAELTHMQQRAAAATARSQRYALQGFATELLTVADNLDHALAGGAAHLAQSSSAASASSSSSSPSSHLSSSSSSSTSSSSSSLDQHHQQFASFYDGVAVTRDSLHAVFGAHGIAAIDTRVHDLFNPNIHEAVTRVPFVDAAATHASSSSSSSQPPHFAANTVHAVLQTGYTIGASDGADSGDDDTHAAARLLRPVRVAVVGTDPNAEATHAAAEKSDEDTADSTVEK